LGRQALEGQKIRLRSGVHLGQVIVERRPLNVDVIGRHVNRAARVQAAAEPGEDWVTEPGADNVRGWTDKDDARAITFLRMGTRIFKGIEEPIAVFRADYEDPKSPASAPGMLPARHIILVVRDASGQEKEYVFDPERDRRVILGRAPECDVRLATPLASRRHLMIICSPNGVWSVQDLATRSGVYLNTRRVESMALAAGDVIRIGDVTITVQAMSSGAP
jgi:hypothetical protein